MIRVRFIIPKPRLVSSLRRLDQDTLDLIEADRIVGAIIELGRARGFVVGYLLSVFDCATIL